MVSLGERGTNCEFRVQNVNAPAEPAPPRMVVEMILRKMPIVESGKGARDSERFGGETG